MAIIYVLGGGAAAGKSTFVKDVLELRKMLVQVPIVCVMPENMNAQIPNFNVNRDHEKAASMTRVALADCIARDEDIIYDTALADPEAFKFLEYLLSCDYLIHVMYVDCGIDEARRRNSVRDKCIPDNVLFDFHVRAAKNFFHIYNEMRNDVDLSLSYSQNMKFSSVYLNHRMYQPALYAKYQEKALLCSDGSGYTTFNTIAEIEEMIDYVADKKRQPKRKS